MGNETGREQEGRRVGWQGEQNPDQEGPGQSAYIRGLAGS